MRGGGGGGAHREQRAPVSPVCRIGGARGPRLGGPGARPRTIRVHDSETGLVKPGDRDVGAGGLSPFRVPSESRLGGRRAGGPGWGVCVGVQLRFGLETGARRGSGRARRDVFRAGALRVPAGSESAMRAAAHAPGFARFGTFCRGLGSFWRLFGL